MAQLLVLLFALVVTGVNVYGIFYHDRWHTWYRISLFLLTSVDMLTLVGIALAGATHLNALDDLIEAEQARLDELLGLPSHRRKLLAWQAVELNARLTGLRLARDLLRVTEQPAV